MFIMENHKLIMNEQINSYTTPPIYNLKKYPRMFVFEIQFDIKISHCWDN